MIHCLSSGTTFRYNVGLALFRSAPLPTLHPGFLPHKLPRCMQDILTHPRVFQTNKLCMELNVGSFLKICWLLFLLFYVHSICTVAEFCFTSPLFLRAVERLHMNHTVPFDILPHKSSLRYLHMLIPAHYTHLSHVT